MHKSTKINQEGLDWALSQPIDKKIEILSNHLTICKIVLNSVLDHELNQKVGPKYCRVKTIEQEQFRRWGVNPGSVRIGNQKIPVQVPRVQNITNGFVENLDIYDQIRDLPEQKEEMIKSVLKGISMRDYHSIATTLDDNFGLSRSSISNHLIDHTEQVLQKFLERKIEDKIVALFIDGKYLQREQMMIVMGVTEFGIKRVLSVVQTHGERAKPIQTMLEELIDRGLDTADGLLVIVDGSKGIAKAIQDAFGNNAIVQRCQWHKQENVLSYLADEHKETVKKELQEAYNTDDYSTAKQKIEILSKRLEKINMHASKSLNEGMEETLAIHKLGLAKELRKSFMTTNIIESLNSQVGKFTNKIKRWEDSNMRYRWTVYACTEVEPKMHRVTGYKSIHLLQENLKNRIANK